MRANGGLRFGETIRTGEEAPRFVAGYTDIRTVWRDVQVPGATVATSDAVRKSEAIAARKQRFPDEKPFVYRPHAEAGRSFEWDEAGRRAIRNYEKLDLFI